MFINLEKNKENYIKKIKKDLYFWWQSGGERYFPWRETQDPYKILIAEILLHRTRAEQVVSAYNMFLTKYPDLNSVISSSPEELKEKFLSLGLYWRWKMLYSMALEIEKRFNGKIPNSFEDLCSLPGINHYIASSIRCFALGYRDVILDTNTVRVAGRLFGLEISDKSRRDIRFREVLENFLGFDNPRDFNFMLLDFAAIICKSKNPLHEICPVKKYCKF